MGYQDPLLDLEWLVEHSEEYRHPRDVHHLDFGHVSHLVALHDQNEWNLNLLNLDLNLLVDHLVQTQRYHLLPSHQEMILRDQHSLNYIYTS